MNDRPAQQDGSFLGLNRVHEELEELFLRHQKALLGFRIPEAIELLDLFEKRLRLHMRHEEDWLLPIYDQRGGRPGRSKALPAEVYVLEHRKMLDLLGKVRCSVAQIAPPAKPSPCDIIALLDRECSFKHLVEHHNMREHNVLYAELDRLTSEKERRELTDRCAREWAASRSKAS